MAELDKINIRAPFSPPAGQVKLDKENIRVVFSAPRSEIKLNKASLRIIIQPKPPRPQRRDILPFPF